MKNNKIENLLKQENNAPDILQDIKTPKTFVKREKTKFISRFSLKQRVVALSVACSLLVIAIITPLLIIFLGGMENYDKLIIKNFDQYDKIGVGVESTTSTGMSGLGFVSLGNTYASSGNKKHTLIGQKKNGDIEQLILKDMKTDKETTPKLALTSMWSGENFTIVNYRRDNIYGNFSTSNYFSPDENSRIYLIDNNTGKFYSLNDFSNFTLKGSDPISKAFAEGDNTLFILGRTKQNSHGSPGNNQSLFELRIENEELRIEELISQNDFSFQNYYVDRYSNVYIGGVGSNQDGTNYVGVKFKPSAILKASKNYAVETINEELILSQNRIVYTADENYRYNENGEKVANDFMDFNHFYEDYSLIQKNENTEYYYHRGYDTGSQTFKYYIEKVTWIDDIKFTVEKIDIEDYADKYVFTNDKIYFLENEEVFSIDIYDGTKESLVSDYLFSEIQTNNLGEVLFTAINKSDRQAVNGKINKNGQIEINFQKIKYDVLYIKPLN